MESLEMYGIVNIESYVSGSNYPRVAWWLELQA